MASLEALFKSELAFRSLVRIARRFGWDDMALSVELVLRKDDETLAPVNSFACGAAFRVYYEEESRDAKTRRCGRECMVFSEALIPRKGREGHGRKTFFASSSVFAEETWY